MPAMLAARVLRSGLLEGVSLLVVGSAGHDEPASESLGRAVGEVCEQLGSRVHAYSHEPHALDPIAGAAAIDVAVTNGASAPGGIDMLIVDGAAMFASGGLRGC